MVTLDHVVAPSSQDKIPASAEVMLDCVGCGFELPPRCSSLVLP